MVDSFGGATQAWVKLAEPNYPALTDSMNHRHLLPSSTAIGATPPLALRWKMLGKTCRLVGTIMLTLTF
jgi:hypothetical protein